MPEHEFAVLYNDDERGRCATECYYAKNCVNQGGMSTCPRLRFRPDLIAKIDFDGIIRLSCTSHKYA